MLLSRVRVFIERLPIIRELLATEVHARQIERLLQETFVGNLMASDRYRDPKRLATYEYQLYSQNGEDGILTEIFRRIGATDKTFVEVGAGTGTENNTAFFLSRGWRGCWVEGNPGLVERIRRQMTRYLDDGTLKLVDLFVTRENIAPVLRSVQAVGEVDLLSLDVDQNTYWVWEGLADTLKPRVAVVEYNPSFPSWLDWKVQYDAKAVWDGSFNYGASLKAYELLGTKLGYALVGCDITGNNAFFVRQDLCGDKFHSPYTSEEHYEPPRFWLGRGHGHFRPKGLA
jgi:hypothetical protein